jgi:quinol monooxygenase YgiN
MIVEYIRYTVPSDRQNAFVSAYGEASRFLRESPHCLGFEISQCTEEPERYIVRIEWRSQREHTAGFRGEPNFGSFFALIRPFLDGIAEMQHYRPTSLVWSAPS